ncbi:hypothetical protein DL770_009486 [Monosporascus sp. CRB-9-2]|nr:hypothetical protein DL770_009486 [Monosporascus sp. CRB-9-2]
MADGTVTLATSAVGLGAIGLLTIPTIASFRAQVCRRHVQSEVYEDKDGKSTPEAVKAFATKVPRGAILILNVIGLGLSVTLAALATLSASNPDHPFLLEDWICAGAWSIAIVSTKSCVNAFDLGIYSTISGVILVAVRIVQGSKLPPGHVRYNTEAFAIRAAEIAVVISLAVASFSIPRRPDVFHDGKLVDRSYTGSAWSRYNWSWPADILRTATKKNNLDLTDLPRPGHLTRAKETTEDWESRKFTGPLWLSIISAHKWTFALQWFGTLLTAILNFTPQWCVLQLLKLLERRQDHQPLGLNAWMWVVWIGVATLAQSWVESWVFWMSWAHLCVPIRAQLSSLIFQKSMRRKDVKEATKKKTASGSTEPTIGGPAGGSNNSDRLETEETEEDDAEKVNKSKQSTVNLIGVDATHVSDFASFNNYFPGSVFKLIVSLTFLVDLLGWKALLAGSATMAVLLPVNIYFSKRYSDAQDRLMKVRDEKMEIVSEALQGIRQIKFSALEPQWEKKIGDVRERELKCIWDTFFNDTMLIACWVTSPIMLAAVSIAVYAALYGRLEPSVAFVSLGVFKALEVTLSVIPELTTDLVDAWVSVKRIDTYLQSPEISRIAKDSDLVSFDNASIAWPSDSTEEDPDRFVLRDVTVTFPKGELSVVSGKTGSGKSLMLAAILGEVDIMDGSLSVPRAPPLNERHDSQAHRGNWIIPEAIAYVAQIPWIENATVKDNILFGLPYDEYRYKKTIEVCALTKDLEMFTDGDNTEIGANGINLSGGQKWRITLARAIYSRAGILVLDDIFSAVDAHVGRHIFDKCLNGELGVGRTRILVTHHVALCEPKTKYLVELGDGRVLHAGLVSELEDDGTLQQIKSHEQTEREIQEDEEATAVNSETSQIDGEPNGEPLTRTPSKAQQPRKFVEEEAREEGAIKKHVYATYLRDSGGWPFWLGALLLYLLLQALTVGESWWLRLWTGSYEEEKQPYASQFVIQHSTMHRIMQPMVAAPSHGLNFYLGIYILLSLLTSFLGTAKYYYVFQGSIRASRKLFAKLNFVVLRAPLRWLDTVPVGRVLNRFTADFDSVDTSMAYSLAFAGSEFLNLIGVVVAGLFVSPVIVIFATVLLAVCVRYASRYLHGARPVKRLESTTKSPVFEQFASALTGVTTIRGFGKPAVYIDRMHARLDDWTVATWHLWLFNRWMGWRMSVVGSFFASLVAALILLTPGRGMDPALAGFALAFALEFSEHIIWTIRNYASVELEMNAAERVVEYSELPTESLGGERPPAAWPTEGRIEVEDLVVGYAADLPPVLKGLTFRAERGERVGVVGRTGAGKSSLTLALFRFLEARSGSIRVDGLDISGVRLHDLRSRLAIIPQDPVLFSGTVRSNLDPFDDHTDAELFDSLRRVHLIGDDEDQGEEGQEEEEAAADDTNASKKQKNTNPFASLDTPISEGGLNLSQGQRQLLCLARAIASRPRVMVLDEATSAVDMATDARIQRSIRDEFGSSGGGTTTLLVIAHRLSTIADFDRILVLADGRAAEFGTPRELWDLRRPAAEGGGEGGETWGLFRAMCEESGERYRLREMICGKDGDGKN